MKKKILKIIGVVVLLIVVLLIAAPFFLQGKIEKIIKDKVNNNIEATLDFASADLSLFSSFPNAKVTINELVLTNNAPFKGDTLFASKEIALDMAITELFKDSSEAIGIKSLAVDGAALNIIVNKDSIANYDIAKKDTAEPVVSETEEEGSSFTLAMESYKITNSKIVYVDQTSGMALALTDLQHSGTGDLSLEKSELDTKTNALVSFGMGGTNYLNRNKVGLDALIGIDLKESKFSFLKNEALVNQLPLVFDGFVKINEDNQEVNINFKTLSSEFKNFLALVPEEYTKSIENVKTTGKFTVEGKLDGIVDETHIPKFSVKLNSDNASFKYPDLPKAVTNIFINAAIDNTTGLVEDTSVDIKKLAFAIDQDRFNLNSQITDLMGNTKVKAHLDGNINLANISQAYPVPADLNLKGILKADVSTAFDMASIEKEQYQNTTTSGTLDLKDFEYNSNELKNPVEITTTSLTFNPETVSLNDFQGKTGKTDFSAKGTITNLLGFMFKDEKVKGDFALNSNTFALNDFMVDEVEETEKSTEKTEEKQTVADEKLKIPSFLDATITANANTVLYDNLTLKDVKGTLKVKDETATLSNMTTSLFGGKMAFNGEVSTKNDAATFAMNLGMNQFNISQALKGLEMLEVLAPVAKIIRGNLNSDISIAGNLKDDFTPDLATISGKVLAELMQTELDGKQEKFVTALSDKLSFLKPEKLNLNGLKTALTFDNGKVAVKPFKLNYGDIVMNVAGSHTFDSKLAYNATVEVPAKYLGSDVTKLIAKIDDEKLEDLTIPVTANIGGNFTSPEVKTDLTSGVKNLTSQLIEIEKQKLIAKGKDKATSVISDLLNKNKSKTDSLTQDDAKTSVVKDVVGGLLGKKDTTAVKKDTATSTKQETQKEAVKEILGGLFGKKKKETEKDTTKQ
ncbi:AsmA-like C-terminal region-containing protein [Cellulophaga lytica]|uniref:Putative outer membrane protein n=1 Tax=Cellulophaga lytica (strain ATCC 23178 / DSM 7489 / JCM 8516 / NBRC 14961 / NCIMB 1423 / VKM B-1433 / Cy l20) TaxID=867900 RepID=F0RD54_CELLC|nr:AsmA-like C-terminal region-containing protein [Cellulophaga lytica]ADY29755.1 putative outer membrane protein [Cellulophaga lytica DSM 7489]WQG76076.1 AsmA-like C-terminal region-containing protein [Cellulophaga lytica]